MTKKGKPDSTPDEQVFYDALRRIASYDSAAKLHRESQKQWGVSYTEALEMAYDNVIAEAKYAVKGKKRPVVKGETSA